MAAAPLPVLRLVIPRGPVMRITTEIVAQVQRLLTQENHSQRQAAALVGISRGTVRLIAQGRLAGRAVRSADSDDDDLRPPGVARRCPGCGGMVYLPCRLCRVRAWMARPRCPTRNPRGDRASRGKTHPRHP